MDWKEKYFELLGDPDITDDKIDQAIQLKFVNTPRFLYKYRPANENAFDNLENDAVWLDKPARFNDPYEFAEFLDFEKIGSVINERHLKDIIELQLKSLNIPLDIIERSKLSTDPLVGLSKYILQKEGRSESEIQAFVATTNKFMNSHHIKIINNKVQMMQEHMKAASFCESPEQLLMWSHYADHHKGFCIRYDLSKWAGPEASRRSLYPVRYEDKIYNSTQHIINSITKSNFNPLYPLVSGATKSKEWQYEKEWRIIFNVGPSFQPQNYKMNCQTAVYLGYRTENQTRKWVLEIAKRKRLEVYETSLSTSEFKVEFKKIL